MGVWQSRGSEGAMRCVTGDSARHGSAEAAGLQGGDGTCERGLSEVRGYESRGLQGADMTHDGELNEVRGMWKPRGSNEATGRATGDSTRYGGAEALGLRGGDRTHEGGFSEVEALWNPWGSKGAMGCATGDSERYGGCGSREAPRGRWDAREGTQRGMGVWKS
ncbi:hypothetical protein GUJ93_ZPchr0008g12139 [Zizania palustris]|uniref:Uncharacterized protein n=1 Tax=Zizania palustris TaxID=103762 RepID=A0A8J5RNU0_ZIZPA|nr:hypothetical protein GUJ93_ZPchr0008g12139 [Zizania palustris]